MYLRIKIIGCSCVQWRDLETLRFYDLQQKGEVENLALSLTMRPCED